MVYINYINSMIAVILLIILSILIVMSTYLWVNRMEDKIGDAIDNEISERLCNCFSIVDFYDNYVVMINRCNVVKEFKVVENGLSTYEMDKVDRDEIVRFKINSTHFVISYDGCTQNFVQ